MDRAGAKRFDVRPRGVPAAGLLGDRLAEVPAAALVAVADRLLATADGEVDVVGREARLAQEVLERERPRRLAREILEQDGRSQALVEVVCGGHRARDRAVRVEGERAVAGWLAVEPEELERVGGGHALVELVLRDEDAVWALGERLDGVAPPGPLGLPERLGPEVADEDLMRWVGERVARRSAALR